MVVPNKTGLQCCVCVCACVRVYAHFRSNNAYLNGSTLLGMYLEGRFVRGTAERPATDQTRWTTSADNSPRPTGFDFGFRKSGNNNYNSLCPKLILMTFSFQIIMFT